MMVEDNDLEKDLLKSFESSHINRPLCVLEDRYSVQGSSCRENLVLIVEFLAYLTIKDLQEDAKIHRRYATKGKLFNEKNPVGENEEKYDIFPLVLPIRECCWNDVSAEDLQISILNSIENIRDHSYKWYNVRIVFEHFISAKTKKLIDLMDSDNEVEGEEDTLPGCSVSHTPQINVARARAQMNAGHPQINAGLARIIADRASEALVQEDDDDDDECVIVFESTK